MLELHYHHPMHGKQVIKCHKIIELDGKVHVKNIHGVTFQLIDADRIKEITPV